jgi:hypothetical protein
VQKRQALAALRDAIDRIKWARAYVKFDPTMTLRQFEAALDELETAAARDIDDYMAGLYDKHNTRRRPPLEAPSRKAG